MITVGAHQPNFLPWAGFWHKLVNCNVFVVVAGFRFSRRSYENRVKMRDNNGWATVPVHKVTGTSLDAEIADPSATAYIARRIDSWSRMHRYSYRARLAPIIERLATNTETRLSRLNFDLMELTMEALGHTGTRLVFDSEVRLEKPVGHAICDIVLPHGGTYLSGSSGPKYVERDELARIPTCLVQRLVAHVPTESILHLIAEEEDPLLVLRGWGRFELWT